MEIPHVRKVNEPNIVSERKRWEVKAKLVIYLGQILLSKVFLFLQVCCGCDQSVYVCMCVHVRIHWYIYIYIYIYICTYIYVYIHTF